MVLNVSFVLTILVCTQTNSSVTSVSEIQTKKNTNRSSCIVRGGHTFLIIIRRSNPMALEAYVDTPYMFTTPQHLKPFTTTTNLSGRHSPHCHSHVTLPLSTQRWKACHGQRHVHCM